MKTRTVIMGEGPESQSTKWGRQKKLKKAIDYYFFLLSMLENSL
jgi:hypothetical protein